MMDPRTKSDIKDITAFGRFVCAVLAVIVGIDALGMWFYGRGWIVAALVALGFGTALCLGLFALAVYLTIKTLKELR